MEQLSRALERIVVPESTVPESEPEDVKTEMNLLEEQKLAKEQELLDKLESASSTLEADPVQSLQPACDPEKILEALLVEKEKEVEQLKAENERLKGQLRHQANQKKAKSESTAFASVSSPDEEMSPISVPVGADKRLE